MSRGPLLVECRLLCLEEIPLIKGNGVLPVYRWNAALNQWTECHAVCRYSVANESRFSRRFTVSSGPFLITKPSDATKAQPLTLGLAGSFLTGAPLTA